MLMGNDVDVLMPVQIIKYIKEIGIVVKCLTPVNVKLGMFFFYPLH